MPDGRPSADELLSRIESEERRKRRGRLKVFLGYASGVGKSVQMLDEGRRRRERGEDIVVGAIQPQSSPDVQELLSKLEVIPMRQIGDRQTMDLAAIENRHPQVVLIDGLAYDNPAGAKTPTRWQDIEELLGLGISVITSVNLQYVAELQDEIVLVTGKRSSETVPRSFLEKADEIVVADVPAAESLIRSGPGRSGATVSEAENRLSRLREMTMLLAAGVVDLQLQSYLRSHGIEEMWGTQERILVCLTPRSNARQILESGRRNADRFYGELFATYVKQPTLSADDQAALDRNMDIAREVGAQLEVLEGADSVKAIIRFAREKGITQIFIGHSMRAGWWNKLRGNPVERLIESAEGIDVRVFPQRPGQ
jgi:two-component system sensor histidine kinase KdpD